MRTVGPLIVGSSVTGGGGVATFSRSPKRAATSSTIASVTAPPRPITMRSGRYQVPR